MTAYIAGAILCALLVCFLFWKWQPTQGQQSDTMRLIDTVALLIKYVPWLLAGTLLGLGIVYLL